MGKGHKVNESKEKLYENHKKTKKIFYKSIRKLKKKKHKIQQTQIESVSCI